MTLKNSLMNSPEPVNNQLPKPSESLCISSDDEDISSDDEKQAIHCASFDLQENHENYTTWSVSLIGFS